MIVQICGDRFSLPKNTYYFILNSLSVIGYLILVINSSIIYIIYLNMLCCECERDFAAELRKRVLLFDTGTLHVHSSGISFILTHPFLKAPSSNLQYSSSRDDAWRARNTIFETCPSSQHRLNTFLTITDLSLSSSIKIPHTFKKVAYVI